MSPDRIEIKVKPIGKPRMTRSDTWKKRPCVVRYYGFKDVVVLACNKEGFKLADEFRFVAYIPMSKSWSKKKKKEMSGTPHQLKPDIDNIAKAVMDSLKEKDETVFSMQGDKYWSEEPLLVIINK